MTTTRAVLYSRVSTTDQADGVSLETQLDMARRYCEDRGWVLGEVYTDVMSGRSDRRPEFKRLQADAASHGFEVVLIYKIDRLARSAPAFYRIASLLKDHQIALVSLTESFDMSRSEGKAMVGMLAIFAEIFSDQLSERVRGAMRTVAAKGLHTGGWCPYGYAYTAKHKDASGTVVEGHLEISPESAEVVRLIFSTFIETRSLRATSEHLNAMGLPSPRGSVWRIDTMSNILHNPAYIGQIAYGRTREFMGTRGRKRIRHDPSQWTIHENAHPAIIDPETWETAQEILDGNRGFHSSAKRARVNHPWSGMLKCGACGDALYRHKTKVGTYEQYQYVCGRYFRCGKTACLDYGRVREGFLDGAVIQALDEALNKAKLMAKAQSHPSKVREIRPPASKSSQIASLEKKRERELELFRAGYVTLEKMDTAVKKIDAEIRALADRPVEIPRRPLPDFGVGLSALWADLSIVARGETLRALIDHGEVVPGKMILHLHPFDSPGWPDKIELRINYSQRGKLDY